MNVTSKGYFTNQFLDKQKQQSPQSYYRQKYQEPEFHEYDDEYDDEWESEFQMGSVYHPHHSSDPDRVSEYRLEEPFEAVPKSPSLKTKRSKATLAHSHPRSVYSPGSSPASKQAETIESKDSKSAEIDFVEAPEQKDPDYLEQGITPAELNYLQNRSRPVPHRAQRRSPYSAPNVHFVKKPKKDYDEYYIKQKKLYDEADYKPKLYTHKTFRDVFQNKEENMDKYNPMEFVFDGQPEGKNLRSKFRELQVKMGKDDYASFDYYEDKEARKNAPPEVFVDEVSDVDDETESAGEQKKKNKRISKMLKKRVTYAKQELGRNFMSNSERQRQIHELMVERETKKKRKKGLIVDSPKAIEAPAPEDEVKIEKIPIEEIVEEAPEEKPEEKDDVKSVKSVKSFGPRPDFHPAWNYLLSWVVYDPPPKEQIDDVKSKKSAKSKKTMKSLKSAKTVKTLVIPKGAKVNLQQLKNLKKGYSTVVNKWNEPVGTLFNDPGSPSGKSLATTRRSGRSPTSSIPLSELDELDGDQEFTIEVDDDGSETNMELYYNPVTKQLEATPPTSMGSLDLSSYFGTRGGGWAEVSKGPVAIISSINSLIKNIKIMKIIFTPIDVIGENFPNLQTVVILLELVIFVWILYELSLLIDALCMMVKAVCAPMIAMGRFMNRIM